VPHGSPPEQIALLPFIPLYFLSCLIPVKSVHCYSSTLMVKYYRQGKTPDSSTRALWQSCHQGHLVSYHEERGEGNDEFRTMKYLCSYFEGILT
jgi:hypothetical protein